MRQGRYPYIWLAAGAVAFAASLIIAWAIVATGRTSLQLPQQLYQSLLTGAVSTDDLPQGFTAASVTAGAQDPSDRPPSGLIGAVQVAMSNQNSGSNGPGDSITYEVFKSTGGASDRFNALRPEHGTSIDGDPNGKCLSIVGSGSNGPVAFSSCMSRDGVTFISVVSHSDANARALAAFALAHLRKIEGSVAS